VTAARATRGLPGALANAIVDWTRLKVARSMLIFKVLHILSMFTAVTLLISVPIFAALAIWQRDVRGLAAVYRLARRPGNTVVGSVFLLAGVVFGLLTAATGGLDFFAGWLIAAYVMVTALILTNFLPAKRRVRQVAEDAVEAEAGQRPVDDVVRDMATAPIAVFAIDVAFFAAIIADMVLKPF
jgi:hypothetical protein